MFALNQTSASRRTLLSLGSCDTALSATDRPPEVFFSSTNRATHPPLAYDAQIVSHKPSNMNTCTKRREGEGDLSRSGLKLLIRDYLLDARCQSRYSSRSGASTGTEGRRAG